MTRQRKAEKAKEWIAQYLESKPPYSVDERTEALSTGHPFRFEESGESLVALSGADFRKWLRVTQQEKNQSQENGFADARNRWPAACDGRGR